MNWNYKVGIYIFLKHLLYILCMFPSLGPIYLLLFFFFFLYSDLSRNRITNISRLGESGVTHIGDL